VATDNSAELHTLAADWLTPRATKNEALQSLLPEALPLFNSLKPKDFRARLLV
jgi:hypothetical protein